MPTVLLAEAHPQVRSALLLVVEQKLGWEVCGVAVDVLTLLSAVERSCPDLIILDAELAGIAGRTRVPTSYQFGELVRLVHRLCPPARLVALSSKPELQASVLTAGVHAFISKNDPPDTLMQALRSVFDPPSLDSIFRRQQTNGGETR